MESQQFTVLYTHQKMKKSKVWQDGILKISHLGNKAILYDDKGECLESLFLKCPEVRPGDDLEGDRYLVTVEDVRLAGSIAVNQDASKAAPASRPRRPVSSGWALRCPPAGLKRKFIGFQGPRQVPKKMVIENGESIASLETVNADPIFLSPFSNTPLLFSAAGKKAVNRILTDPENTVVHKDRKRKGPPPFSACSRSDPEVLWGDHLCSSVTSADEQSVSLLTSGPMQRDGLASHCLGVTHSIRSKAQILALLKSKSTSMYKEVNSEMTGHFPQVQPQGSLKFSAKPKCLIEQEESAEKKTESLQYQRLSEKTVRNKSRWAMYLSSQSSPVCDSAVDGNDPERKATAQGENINLNSRDRLVQKRIQFLETGAENGENCNEDTLVHSADPSWGQEGDVEISSLWERNVENDGLVSESDIQEDIKMPVNQNGQMCTKGSVLVGEKAQEIRSRGAPEKDCKQAVSDVPEPEHLQSESSLRDSFGVSDAITDMFSESNTDNESLGVIEPVSNVTQPVLEINFNLTNFETSDTEEECQESNKLSQDPEGWRKETLADDCNSGVQKRCEGVCCEEGASARLPLSVPTGAKLTETFPTKETLLSQVCGTTCAGFNTGPWNAGPTRDETERCSDSPLEWTNDVCVGNEDVTTSIQKVRSEYDFASLLNKSKGINSNLHIPRFLNIGTNQTPESSHSSEQTQHQSFIIESDLDKNDKQILPSISDSDNSIQLLNASQNHTEECIALDKPNPQVSNSLFYPLGREHPISKDTEAHLPESEDLGGIPTLPHDLFKVDTARGSSQYWSSPRNSSEPSGLVNSICLLKSLSEHNTALEGLEILKKKNTTFKQGALQTHEPENTPEAEKPLITVVLPAVSESHLNQDSQQCSTPTVMKENELEPSESLQSLQCFSLKSEEETAFPAVTPKPTERKTWDCQPVEFQGHQVQGSVTSAVMVRGHSSQLDCGQFPVLHERGSGAADTRSWAAELPSPGVQVDFFQVISPEQKVSTLSPESAFSLDSRDKDFMQEFSTESLKARTLPVMKKFHSLENQNLQRLPLVSRNRVPFVTVPPSDGPPDIESQSCAIACDKQVSSGSPLFHLGEESTILSLSSVPEDQSETSLSREVTAGNVALLDPISAPSKWLKYQNTLQDGLMTPSRADTSLTDFFAESTSGMCFSDTSERRSDAVRESSIDAVQMVRGMLRQQQQSVSTQDFVCRKKTLSLSSKPISTAEDAQNVLRESAHYSCSVTDLQEINSSELCFPSGQKIKSAYLPRRQILIPAGFQSPAHYKQIFTSCLIEHLNILLFGLAQRLHKALSAVDISFYTSPEGEKWKTAGNNMPSCCHHQPAKLVMVKKEGPNKGRLFYTCDAPKADQCKFFKWLEEMTPGHLTQEDSLPAMVLSDIKSLGLYLRSQKIPLYEECQLLVRKGFDFQRKQYGKLKKFTTVNPEFYSEPKGRLYLKLSRKETSSTYSKDDLWVVSKTLDFELDTFIACSAFFGPSSVNELELLPLKGYCPSSWPTNTVVHALLVCNASTELTSLKNIQDHFNPATLPLTPHLLAMSSSTIVSNKRVDKRKFIPPAFSNTNKKWDLPSLGAALQLASELIQAYKLNGDQAAALTQIARMVASQGPAEEEEGLHSHSIPITIIHGVFGAGKSYLLAVVILFFVQLFEKSEAPTVGNARPWKLLVSSSTNVAVDRVLLGLLSLGFEKFVRVGSVRKIAKPILPYSLHVGSENANEQLKELHALMKEDLTPTEKVYVRKSIEQHKLGTNRALLRQVRVVGVTCAACPFPCMNNLKFPVVVLDECSQMTEPTSLLPIARFECEKLILVGDPKQLPPTIQGSDAGHKNGLEQTLFDRLCLMGHKPVLLRTQYRCHPAIAAVASDLFYGGNLRNGVSETDRSPLLEWLPTLCFYNVQGKEQIEGGNSFHNVAEAAFTLKLIQSLVACGLAGSMIGVVTLYRSQMCKLCQLLSAVAVDCPSLRAVQVSTVDAFQGAEKEVIVLSCVRTRQVGFIDSEQRMNVALTRGRRHLLIVGNLACLRKNRLWECVIQHCEGREGGLQHARQCEPQLDRLLEDYFERRAEEKQKKKSGRDRSEDESHSQEGLV